MDYQYATAIDVLTGGSEIRDGRSLSPASDEMVIAFRRVVLPTTTILLPHRNCSRHGRCSELVECLREPMDIMAC